jgi:hypothetical protein
MLRVVVRWWVVRWGLGLLWELEARVLVRVLLKATVKRME